MEYLYSEPYNVERKKDGLDSSNQNNHFVIIMILITLVGYDMRIQWQMRVCLIPHGASHDDDHHHHHGKDDDGDRDDDKDDDQEADGGRCESN